MVGGAATFAVIAIMIGINMRYRKNDSQQLQQQHKPAPRGKVLSATVSQPQEEVALNSKPEPLADMKKSQSTVAEEWFSENTTKITSSQQKSSTLAADLPAKEVSKKSVPAVENSENAVSSLKIRFKSGLYARIQLLVRTVELLKATITNPALRENVQKGLDQLKNEIVKKLVLLQEAETRQAVWNRASLVPHYTLRYTSQFLSFTFRHARDTLGGDELEELELL